MIELNRKLDDMEDMLSPSCHVRDEHMAYANEELRYVGDINHSSLPGLWNEQVAMDAASSSWLGTPEPAKHVNEEKFELLPQLNEAMEQLRERQKGTKMERATVRARHAEAENEALTSDLMDDEAELKYLKLKLRILEIQTLPYMPAGDFDGLAVGIQRWKSDWAEVQSRQSWRRRKRGLDKQKDSYSWSTEDV
ncbi:MAG: hypothetical protein Q9184_002952 [Pyrenodesmia sp. 2 TL-2023]